MVKYAHLMSISRNEFIKLSKMFPLGKLFSYWETPPDKHAQDTNSANILIVVFDALSARHIQLHGYPRYTMPNLARLAENATVFHRHFAGGNFTTPGTASLLTGNYPFTHRAYKFNSSVINEFSDKNIFSYFPDYTKVAYSHNVLVNTLLNQFHLYIQEIKPRDQLAITDAPFVSKYFSNDIDIAQVAWTRIIKRNIDIHKNTPIFSALDQIINQNPLQPYEDDFPRGMPVMGPGENYILEHAIDWIKNKLAGLSQPFLGYFHLFPPHQPYNTSLEFIDHFLNDGFYPNQKPDHPFSDHVPQPHLENYQRQYDEFILYADQALGDLYRFLDESGLSKNTWLVFTSDHGELFERGIWQHITPTMFQSVVHIPLVIQAPGQSTRTDVYTPTSAVDILPTLLQVSGIPIPVGLPGQILPPYQTENTGTNRSIYAVEAKMNSQNRPLKKASLILVKWPYKLVEYRGYKELAGDLPAYEMYNLADDPEELEDIFSSSDPTARQMVQELRHTVKPGRSTLHPITH